MAGFGISAASFLTKSQLRRLGFNLSDLWPDEKDRTGKGFGFGSPAEKERRRRKKERKAKKEAKKGKK